MQPKAFLKQRSASGKHSAHNEKKKKYHDIAKYFNGKLSGQITEILVKGVNLFDIDFIHNKPAEQKK